MMSPTAAKVAGLIKKTVEDLGLELWDVRYVKEGASWYLRIYIDKDGGISINDCTDVSHAVDPIIDEADPISTAYFLEVCSPGLERELTEPEHFTKYLGKQVSVKLIRPKDGRKDFCGILVSHDGGVTVRTDDGEIYFAKNEIVTVRLSDAENIDGGLTENG